MLYEVRAILQNRLLGFRPLRRVLHQHLGSTGMNGSIQGARARLDDYLRHVDIVDQDLLELGPGHTMEVLMLARERGARRCVGLDVERLTTRALPAGIALDLYAGNDMPYEDASFDVIWSSDVLEHVRNPAQTMAECFRVLRPGGKLLAAIDLRDHYFLHREDQWCHCLRYRDRVWEMMTSNRSSFVNRLRASDWHALISQCGFHVVEFNEHRSELLRIEFEANRIRSVRRLSAADAQTYRIDVVLHKRV